MMSGSKEIQRTDGAGRFEFRVEAYQNRYMVRVVPPEGIDVVKMVNLPVRDDLIVRVLHTDYCGSAGCTNRFYFGGQPLPENPSSSFSRVGSTQCALDW